MSAAGRYPARVEDHPTAIRLVRRDEVDGVVLHTLTANGRPFWLLSQVGRIVPDAALAPWPERLEVETHYECIFDSVVARRVRGLVGEEDDLSHVVLFAEGVTRLCDESKAARAAPLRRLVQEGAREWDRERRRRRTRIEEIVRRFESEDRARKASLLHRIIDHARRAGPLRDDDATYVEAMAIVAEIASGHVFPTVKRDDKELVTALCDEMNA
jgi:hypothetical protein